MILTVSRVNVVTSRVQMTEQSMKREAFSLAEAINGSRLDVAYSCNMFTICPLFRRTLIKNTYFVKLYVLVL